MKTAISWAIALVLIVLGAIATWTLWNSGPEVATEDRAPALRRVRVVAVKPTSLDATVLAYGVVEPAQRTTLRPEVSGRIVRMHPALVDGGLIPAGDELIGIDDRDYSLALRERRAEATEAKVEATLEGGRRNVARREWEAFSRELESGASDSSLALREPQRDLVRARLYGARARVERAQVQLERTSLKAPFAALVLDESVELGMLASPSTDVATLVGTDAFWIEASLPVAELQRAGLHQRTNVAADVTLGIGTDKGVKWKGQVVRVLGSLTEQSRMARVLIEVQDPLDLGTERPRRQVPLMLGSFVAVSIDAGRLDRVAEIPRSALREQDRIWVVGSDNRLRIIDTEVMWRRDETVVIRYNLMVDQRLIVSDLRAPLPGMEVAVEERDEGSPSR